MLQWFRARARSVVRGRAGLAGHAQRLVGHAAPGRLPRRALRGRRAARSVGAQRRPRRHLARRSPAALRPLSLDAHRPAVDEHRASSHPGRRAQRSESSLTSSLAAGVLRGAASASRPAVVSISRRVARVPDGTRKANFVDCGDAFMHVRGFLPACVVLAMAVAMSPHLAAQAGTQLSGRLVNSLSGDPIAGATVTHRRVEA